MKSHLPILKQAIAEYADEATLTYFYTADQYRMTTLTSSSG